MPSNSRTHSPSPLASSSTHRRQPRLTPTTLSIPASRVRKTWRPLPQPTQERIKALLLAIQSQTIASLEASSSSYTNKRARGQKSLYKLPTAASNNSTAQLDQQHPNDHSTAVTTLISRLIRSIPKMAFPPTTASSRSIHQRFLNRTSTTTTTSSTSSSRFPTSVSALSTSSPLDIDFNLEATLQRTAMLSAQLAQTTQSAKLLRMQLRAEEADLQKDRDELSELEENMRRAVAAGREREARMHRLVAVDVAGTGLTTTEQEGEWLGDDDEEDDDEEEEEEEEGRGRGRGRGGEGIYEQAVTVRTRRKLSGGRRLGLLAKEQVHQDAELRTLTDGLRNHLGSMRANGAGMRGVKRELRRAERELRLWGARKGVVV